MQQLQSYRLMCRFGHKWPKEYSIWPNIRHSFDTLFTLRWWNIGCWGSHTINARVDICLWCLSEDMFFLCSRRIWSGDICFVWKNSCGSLFKCFFFFSMFVVLIDYTFMFMTCHKGGSLAHKRYNCLFKSAGRQRLNSGPLPLLFLPVTFSCHCIQVKYTNTQVYTNTNTPTQIHNWLYHWPVSPIPS